MVLNTSQIILLAHRRTTLRRTTPQRCDERSPTRSRDFIWDDEGNPVAMIEAGAITYLHADHLGTPRRGTDAAGTVTWAWDGEAFGASAPSIAAVDVPLRFPGQILDADTGLVFNGWRTYVPAWGRYLESDPVGVAGGVNTFQYALGTPLSNVDPVGLMSCSQNWFQNMADNYLETQTTVDSYVDSLFGSTPDWVTSASTPFSVSFGGLTAASIGGRTILQTIVKFAKESLPVQSSHGPIRQVRTVGLLQNAARTTLIQGAAITGAWSSGVLLGSSISSTLYSLNCTCEK